ncbi:MAG: hypothetical protein ACLFUY_01345 [Desulfobacterales bacterium]
MAMSEFETKKSNPELDAPEKFLTIVDKDEYACFSGQRAISIP